MQEEFDCTYAVADLHAITVRQEPAKLRSQIYSTYAIMLALGLDPEKSTLLYSRTFLNTLLFLGYCLAIPSLAKCHV